MALKMGRMGLSLRSYRPLVIDGRNQLTRNFSFSSPYSRRRPGGPVPTLGRVAHFASWRLCASLIEPFVLLAHVVAGTRRPTFMSRAPLRGLKFHLQSQ